MFLSEYRQELHQTYYRQVHDVEVLSIHLDEKGNCEFNVTATDTLEWDEKRWYVTFAILPIREVDGGDG